MESQKRKTHPDLYPRNQHYRWVVEIVVARCQFVFTPVDLVFTTLCTPTTCPGVVVAWRLFELVLDTFSHDRISRVRGHREVVSYAKGKFPVGALTCEEETPRRGSWHEGGGPLAGVLRRMRETPLLRRGPLIKGRGAVFREGPLIGVGGGARRPPSWGEWFDMRR
uniref:Uncharacterized protein n=1 Tax=Cannabis sativa TaxID=3483 RepID=A0A803P426_CANSA